MEVFEEFIGNIENPEHQARMAEVLAWIETEYPDLGQRIAWNQPMFTDHGTFIIGFSVSKKHMAIAPEGEGMVRLADAIAASGYPTTKMLIQMPWDKPVDYTLIKTIIDFNIADKAECTTFWRK
ncbi:iron chaperone [Listeria booriae]|uniref:Iron chaperone n=1 Tax=Listeria booriae TaxID=1552123 RepID=A0A7X0YZP2_9LIST|nr:iron chaperone [Listeria booriae]MBC1562245.1 iron chaperone [Listeria booriae]MBC1793450.1 iron chaperone [Listeria booriae]MBC2104915.1 iron chaperone [Listeria booriae]MBC2163557.1 iron chaperone [Listeria booriae]MBC2166572.1 iron chaperone [Listeria booriae]